MREQLWVLPSGNSDPRTGLRATVFRPADDEPSTPAAAPAVGVAAAAEVRRPLVIINHGTSMATREAVSLPVYYWMSRWFVERGYVVVLPQRRGHGATAGLLVESVGSCADPDHFRSGQIAAEDVSAAVSFMSKQPFVDTSRIVVLGVSTGGWASLAYAARKDAEAAAVINFAGGRGGHAAGRNNAVCGPARLLEAARKFAATSRAPTLWIYAENDSFFAPDLAQDMAKAWHEGGGRVELELLAPYGSDGHDIADDRAGWARWGPAVDRFLKENVTPEMAEGADPEAARNDQALGIEQPR